MPDIISTEIIEKIIESAVGPKSVRVDGQEVTMPSASEIAKAIYLASSLKAANSRSTGIRMTKMKAGGAIE